VSRTAPRASPHTRRPCPSIRVSARRIRPVHTREQGPIRAPLARIGPWIRALLQRRRASRLVRQRRRRQHIEPGEAIRAVIGRRWRLTSKPLQ